MGDLIRELLTAALLFVGAVFMLLATVGLIRLPDLFTRMQATAKAATAGIGCLFLAPAIYFDALGITSRSILIIVFVFITQPIAAHVLARAGYMIGVPLWDKTVRDEMAGLYELDVTEPLIPGETSPPEVE